MRGSSTAWSPRLVEEGLADSDRLYLTGFSDGGTMYQAHRDGCAATVATPLMAIAGTGDRILPYDGWLSPTGRSRRWRPAARARLSATTG